MYITVYYSEFCILSGIIINALDPLLDTLGICPDHDIDDRYVPLVVVGECPVLTSIEISDRLFMATDLENIFVGIDKHGRIHHAIHILSHFAAKSPRTIATLAPHSPIIYYVLTGEICLLEDDSDIQSKQEVNVFGLAKRSHTHFTEDGRVLAFQGVRGIVVQICSEGVSAYERRKNAILRDREDVLEKKRHGLKDFGHKENNSRDVNPWPNSEGNVYEDKTIRSLVLEVFGHLAFVEDHHIELLDIPYIVNGSIIDEYNDIKEAVLDAVVKKYEAMLEMETRRERMKLDMEREKQRIQDIENEMASVKLMEQMTADQELQLKLQADEYDNLAKSRNNRHTKPPREPCKPVQNDEEVIKALGEIVREAGLDREIGKLFRL